MDIAELKQLFRDPSPTELEFIARYASLPQNGCRERAFKAFAKTGLPHRRIENWRWSDFRAATPALDAPGSGSAADPLSGLDLPTIRFGAEKISDETDLPDGIRTFRKEEALALGSAEDMPLGALTAALATAPHALMIEVTERVDQPVRLVFEGDGALATHRVVVVVRPGASAHFVESHLGGAGLTASLIEYGIQDNAAITRTLVQAGGTDQLQAITATVHLGEASRFVQTALATGAKRTRIETRVSHQGESSLAELNAAYFAADQHHVDFTSHVRHGAPGCTTKQLTRGAAVKGGRGVFQGKFHVDRVAQKTEADMQHNALLLENGADVSAKPELEIYADDVACAHGNTCGALDETALFYMRQRGISEPRARAILTEAHLAAALDGLEHGGLRAQLSGLISSWLEA